MQAIAKFWFPLTAGLLLLLELVLALGPEWSQNEQYSYGWFTPFLFLYLIYNRIGDVKPSLERGSSSAWVRVLAAVLLFTLLPLRTILEGNPEWRMALWAHAFVCIGGLWLLMVIYGGGRLWRVLFPASLLLFFAVPWPTNLESTLTLSLMSVVTSVVVEGMNLFGFYAERVGNLIRLRTGWVGVEEACSGVRSLQSTLMAGWFFGELFRMNVAGRLILLALGVATSFLLNVVRSYLLTYFTLRGGEDLVGLTHDPMGHLIAGIAFVSLLGWALLVKRFSWACPPQDAASVEVAPTLPHAMNVTTRRQWILPIGLVAWLGWIHVFAWAWYARVEANLSALPPAVLHWSAYPADMDFPTIAPAIRNQLRYTEGTEAKWRDEQSGIHWTVFFFSWEAGAISPFVGVHNPESCLPASGFEKVKTNAPLQFPVGGRTFTLESTSFRYFETPVEVFYGTWSNAEGGADLGQIGLRERLRNTARGLRLTDRQSLQIVLRGVESPEAAHAEATRFLEKALGVATE